MPSEHRLCEYDTAAGVGLGLLLCVGLASGLAFSNWVIVDVWLLAVLTGVVLLLLYRLVVAVEQLAHDG